MVSAAQLKALLTPHWWARRAFPQFDLEAIEAAVGRAEQGHLGEIRVVIALGPDLADVLHGRSPRQRAEDAFAHLRVWDTAKNSGVLLYLAWAERQVEIVADRGIAAQVAPREWENICAELARGCGQGRPGPALVQAVEAVGALLRHHCPEGGANPDEQSNRPILR